MNVLLGLRVAIAVIGKSMFVIGQLLEIYFYSNAGRKCDRTFKAKQAMLELSISSFLWFLAMHTVTLTVPDETLQALQTTPENLSQEMLLVVAVKLYELGRLSSGAAANMAGIPRTVFLMKLADYGVDTFRLTEDELAEDIANA